MWCKQVIVLARSSGELRSYLTEPRSWANKIIAIAHNAKAFDLHFILNKAILLKWKPELIMDGLKIMCMRNGLKILCMRMEHLVFLDSVSFLPFPLRRLPEAFGLTSSKSWFPHYFKTEENLDYIGPHPDVWYYGVDEMGKGERSELLEWYEKQEPPFDNRRVLE